MAVVLYSGRARLDLVDIWEWVFHERGEATADRILERIESRIGTLADHPHLGPARPDIATEARALTARRWLVLYAVTEDVVRVVRIIDGAVDLSRIDWPG